MGRLTTIVQGTEDWIRARRGLATASEFARALVRDKSKATETFGVEADAYADEIAAERAGGEDPTFSNGWTTRGNTDESDALDLYESLRFTKVERRQFWVHDTLAIGYSPDGRIRDRRGVGVLEVKCLKLSKHARAWRKPEEAVREYYAQIQGNLWGTGADFAEFVSYQPTMNDERLRLCVIEVDRNEQFITDLALRLSAFCARVDAFAAMLGASDWVPYHVTLGPAAFFRSGGVVDVGGLPVHLSPGEPVIPPGFRSGDILEKIRDLEAKAATFRR